MHYQKRANEPWPRPGRGRKITRAGRVYVPASLATLVAAAGIAASASAAATPKPAAPTGLAAVDAATGIVDLSWKAPTAAPAPLGYEVFAGRTPGGEGKAPLNESPNRASVLISGTSAQINTSQAGLTGDGPFYFKVVAVDGDGASSVMSNEASAKAVAVAPRAPIALTATPSDRAVKLSWAAVTDWGDAPGTPLARESYEVYVGTRSGGESPKPVASVNGAATSTTVTGLANGTGYYFVVRARNSGNIASAPSAQASATPAVGVPDAVSTLSATESGRHSVTLSWTPPANDEGSPIVGYNVFAGTAPGAESAAPLNGSQLLAGTTFTVPGLRHGASYYFTVKAVNHVSESGPSNEVAVRMASVASGAPTELRAAGGYGQVMLSWAAPAGAAQGTTYNIYRSTRPGHEDLSSPIATGVSGTSYTEPNVTPAVGGAFYYTVAAVNAGRVSGPSGEVRAVTGSPSGLLGTSTANAVTLDWAAPTVPKGVAPTLSYEVFEDGGTTPIKTSKTSATISGLASASTHTFDVEAVGPGGRTSSAPAVTIATGGGAPHAPAGLMVTQAQGSRGTAAELSWDAPGDQGASAVTSYDVLVNGTTALPKGAAVKFPSATSAIVSGLKPGALYTFAVRALSKSGASPASATAPFVASTTPSAPPAAVSARIASASSTDVSWAAPAASADGASPIVGYDVFATPTGGSQLLVAANVQGTSQAVAGLAPGTSYTFTVAAVNANGAGPQSKPVAATAAAPTRPGAPGAVSASVAGQLTTLHWAAPSSDGGSAIIGYDIFESPTASTNLVSAANQITNRNGLVNQVPASDSSATILQPAGSYYYQVVAVNAAGDSVGSDVAHGVVALTTRQQNQLNRRAVAYSAHHMTFVRVRRLVRGRSVVMVKAGTAGMVIDHVYLGIGHKKVLFGWVKHTFGPGGGVAHVRLRTAVAGMRLLRRDHTVAEQLLHHRGRRMKVNVVGGAVIQPASPALTGVAANGVHGTLVKVATTRTKRARV